MTFNLEYCIIGEIKKMIERSKSLSYLAIAKIQCFFTEAVQNVVNGFVLADVIK